MKPSDAVRLIKFRYHLAFFAVIAGALVAGGWPSWRAAGSLLVTYVSFNVLLYGGIYTLNDVADASSDRRHPRKKERPVAAGRVSSVQATAFGVAAIISGLVIGYGYFGAEVFWLYAAFVAVNQYYTRVAKKVPYWEIVFNAATYGMRFVLGAMIVGAASPFWFTVAIFLLACGVAIIRRIVELNAPGASARAVLQHYTQKKLEWLQAAIFIAIAVLALIDLPRHVGWYAGLCALYLVATAGTHYSKTVRGFFQWLWLR